MSLYHPLWLPLTPAELQKGREAIERAKTASAKTQRERDYIAALARLGHQRTDCTASRAGLDHHWPAVPGYLYDASSEMLAFFDLQ